MDLISCISFSCSVSPFAKLKFLFPSYILTLPSGRKPKTPLGHCIKLLSGVHEEAFDNMIAAENW